MKLHDFLRITCIIIPLYNGVTVCGAEVHVNAALGISNMWFYTLL